MSGFTFLHAADLHIDSPLIGLGRYEGAPAAEIRVAARRAFSRLIDLAIAESAAFVVIAGDVFDGEWRDYNTGVFFNREVARLERRGIGVFLVHGNHDAQGQMARGLRLPPNSHLFAHEAPETVRLEPLGVAIHGQSFGEPRVTRNLAAGYPPPVPGLLNIGVLHTALDGRDGHDPYAPCKAHELASKGYDYWALGHVHTYEEVSRAPWIVFPGNLQGRSVRETGPKGCVVVRVEDGAVASVRHEAVDVVRWAKVALEVRDDDGPERVIDRLASRVAAEANAVGERLLAVRLSVTGPSERAWVLSAEPHRWRADLESRVASLVGPRVWLEKVRFDVPRPEGASETVRRDWSALETILSELAGETDEPEFVRALAAKLGDGAPRGDASPFTRDSLEQAKADALALLRLKLGGAGGA